MPYSSAPPRSYRTYIVCTVRTNVLHSNKGECVKRIYIYIHYLYSFNVCVEFE